MSSASQITTLWVAANASIAAWPVAGMSLQRIPYRSTVSWEFNAAELTRFAGSEAKWYDASRGELSGKRGTPWVPG